MSRMRLQLRTRPALWLGLLAFALCIRALIPAGMMIETSGHRIEVALCTDASGSARSIAITIPAKGEQESGHDQNSQSACAFSVMQMAAIDAVAAVLLAALLFIFARALLPRARLQRLRSHWRWPPLRGPPSIA